MATLSSLLGSTYTGAVGATGPNNPSVNVVGIAATGATGWITASGGLVVAGGAGYLTGATGSTGYLGATGYIYDIKGDIRSVPATGTVSGALVATDAGKTCLITAGVTVNISIFNIGDVITIYNTTTGALTITQGTSATLQLAGTATTGNRTLAQKGLASLICVAANTFVCSGAGLS
jgi:hypothetical protein